MTTNPVPAAVPAHLRDLSAAHEASHAVIGLLSGIRVTRAGEEGR